MSDLPDSVRIREVGPRDGFQNEPEVIPTADKVRLIELLGVSGLARIEVTAEDGRTIGIGRHERRVIDTGTKQTG